MPLVKKKVSIAAGAVSDQILAGTTYEYVDPGTRIVVAAAVDTAGTATKASYLLKEQGAEKIYMFACHGLFSKNAIDRLEKSQFDKIVVTNTIDQSRHYDKIKKLKLEDKFDVIDVSWMCSEAIRSSFYGESLHLLYDR